MTAPVRIERAQPGDLDDVIALLAEQHLPPDGLLEHFATAVVARKDGRLVGCAAVEMYPDGALLRSVAVASTLQRQGLGRRLAAAAIGIATSHRVAAVYLLTTTADGYFPKLGFERITRADVPPGVQTSIQFTSVCCSSAAVMRKRL